MLQNKCTYYIADLDAGKEVFLRGSINGNIRGDEDGTSGFTGHLILETA